MLELKPETLGDVIRIKSNWELAEMLVYPVTIWRDNSREVTEFTSSLLFGTSYSIREQAVWITFSRISAKIDYDKIKEEGER